MRRILLIPCLLSILVAAALGLFLMPRVMAAPSSKHAAVMDGVGNIVVGDNLPYGNDQGWVNAVPSGGTLRASEAFSRWNQFMMRSFFKAPLSQIGWEGHQFNAVAYLLVFVLPNGKVYQPEGRSPAILYTFGERGRADAAYMARDSHAHAWRRTARGDWPVGYYQPSGVELNVNDPATFQLSHGREVTRNQFVPWNNGPDLKNAFQAGGGKLKLRIYAKVFQFKGVRTVGAEKVDLGQNREKWWMRDHKWTITKAKQYDQGTLVARGEWTIVP